MVLEQLGIAKVTPQGIDRLMAADVNHFEDRRAVGRRRSQEA
jgi:hypothetical protein